MSRRDAPFIHTPNNDMVKVINDRVERNSKAIDELVNGLVKQYCSPLDEYMDRITATVVEGHKVPDELLDEFTLTLPALLYFIGEAQEALGIREDVAKAIKTELYNTVREKAHGTVADKDTAADLATIQEAIVHTVYQRAYKKVKLRVEAGYEMLTSVKKVMTRRITEYEMSRVDPQSVPSEGAKRR